MDGLTFEAEPFRGLQSSAGCGCANCRSEAEASPWEPEASPWGDEMEWDLGGGGGDSRRRDPSCTTAMPADVESCRRQPAVKAILCKPGADVTCPEIPELWKSRRIAGVPFYYGEEVAQISGTKKFQLVSVKQHDRAQEFTPKAWSNLSTWIGLMTTFGMPISAIITAGARYCRCVKRPTGKCGEKKPGGCTGTTLSNHGYGDAVDIAGVYWKDPAAVGSSLKVTLMHSWADSGDQGKLLRRINGALRVAFPTVYDYARSDHRDHFHCDTNRGRGHPNWWKGNDYIDPCEPFFIMGSLKLLGYLSDVKPVNWTRARAGLALFAKRAGMPLPTKNDPKSWDAVVTRLCACVALGGPVGCRQS